MLPEADPTVIYQELGEGAVLFAPGTELYFGLNEAGAVIWNALHPHSSSFEELCARLSAKFPEVSAAVIRSDATELLDQLGDAGLVRAPAPGAGDAGRAR